MEPNAGLSMALGFATGCLTIAPTRGRALPPLLAHGEALALGLSLNVIRDRADLLDLLASRLIRACALISRRLCASTICLC